ncbi:SurA N-terminal domain-containing protein [Leptothrix discophora]|uniref:Periplasmic chaperone PpiD n=1 Tax=Leptothrix discophora TaxID=89 RepID=A0ABT9FZ79_LEPDI|nr:SurA N-terminal domain-containing protein [Leptothrix discophora]MDP4299513.1 SurA N-terminal domain-containing protein [Leptothrix discophora]
MFDFVRRHNRLLQLGLVIVIFPSFVAFGIQGYQSFNEKTQSVAHVDGQPITQAEWDAAHRQQVERMRAQMPNVDAKLLDSPMVRQQVLDQLVRERVMFAAARDLRLDPTDQRLQRLFRADPNFESLRNPDGTVKAELLAMRGMTSAQFAQQLKQDLAMRQVLLGLGVSVPASTAVTTRALDPYFQQREIQVATFSVQDQRAKVQVSDAELKAYFDDEKNAAKFQSKETVSFEYVVLDMAAAAQSVTLSTEDLRKHYDENVARFETPQERRARHILVKIDPSASSDAKAKARAKAEGLLQQLKADRKLFADLARKQSDDPGSATQGGDLDWISRGAMVKPFEDAVFSLGKGELSGLVESEFGLHLIEVTDIRGGERRSFESVRAELEKEVRQQLAQKRYAELAEQFTDLVEQEDNLQAVATKLKLQIGRADKLVRGEPPANAPLLANPKLMETLFDTQTLNAKRNSAPIELGGNQLAAVHVTEHAPSRRESIEEVGVRLRQLVTDQKAAAAAVAAGKAALDDWKQQPTSAALGAAMTVSRVEARSQSPALLNAVMRASTDALPAWVGVDLGQGGYAVVRINKVLGADPAVLEPQRAAAQYAQLWTQAETDAYYKSLRKHFKVDVSAAPAAASGAAR